MAEVLSYQRRPRRDNVPLSRAADIHPFPPLRRERPGARADATPLGKPPRWPRPPATRPRCGALARIIIRGRGEPAVARPMCEQRPGHKGSHLGRSVVYRFKKPTAREVWASW